MATIDGKEDREITLPFRNLEMHVDELGHPGHTNIFKFPLMKKDWCTNLIKIAEDGNKWRTDRHGTYPTTDILFRDVDNELYHEYRHQVLERHVYPIANKLFNNEEMIVFEPGRMKEETFIARYDSTQTDLDLHHDNCTYTCIVTLNSEFEGGGTYFKNQNILVKPDVGHALLHPAQLTHLHGARMTTEGTRYVLVSFISLDPDTLKRPGIKPKRGHTQLPQKPVGVGLGPARIIV